MKNWLGVTTVMILATACASVQKQPSVALAGPASQAKDVDGRIVLTAIEKPQIDSGECGVLLWTLDADRPVPILKFIVGHDGEIALEGKAQSLTLVKASGASGFGVYEELELVSAEGAAVSVSMQFGQGFDGGAYLQRGIITVENAAGWRSVTPAAGIAGCRS